MELIEPNWPAAPRVRALCTTRAGGLSTGGYASLNLADHVGDDCDRVALNRERLREAAALPEEPRWLRQVHGRDVADVAVRGRGVEADAAIADRPDIVCGVLTADCLPVFMCDEAGRRIAVAHAGWRGMVGGVIEATVQAMAVPPWALCCWLGPAIGPSAFEVGGEVRDAFVAWLGEDAKQALEPTASDKWLADLFALARLRLASLGIGYVGGGDLCTFSQPERFYSYRRDGLTGRMASLIWIAS